VLEDPRLSPLDRLRAHFEFMADGIVGAPVINGCMIANFAAESSDETPLIREQIAAIYTQWSALVTRNLQEAADTAGTRGADAEGLAWTLLDSYEGAALRARATRSAAPLRNFLQVTLPLALSAVSGSR
jgi:TetR/AcrR family transcriptional repressor of nem operon